MPLKVKHIYLYLTNQNDQNIYIFLKILHNAFKGFTRIRTKKKSIKCVLNE